MAAAGTAGFVDLANTVEQAGYQAVAFKRNPPRHGQAAGERSRREMLGVALAAAPSRIAAIAKRIGPMSRGRTG